MVAIPSMLVGVEAAHALAYRLVFPQAGLRGAVLAASGHAYAAWVPLVLAVGGAFAIVGLAAAVADVVRGGTVRELGPRAFAALPPLAFALQELLELSLHTGGLAWHAFAAPTFLPGLALQLPFALLAFFVTRLLLRVAVKVGRLLAREHRVHAIVVFWNDCDLLESRSQWLRTSSRAPPLAVGI
jgi:hypothetical protein